MAARRGKRRVTGEAGAAPVAEAAAASASSAAPGAAATTMASGGLQPVVAVDKLADFIEETHAKDDSIAWEKIRHTVGIGGVAVTITGSLYAILSYIYAAITPAAIMSFANALATALGTTATTLAAWLTPQLILLLLLASFIGANIEPITVAIAMKSTSDPAIRAIRVEQVKRATELMRTPGTKAYNAVRTLLTNVGANAAASAARSAAGSAANAVATHVGTAASSAVTAMPSGVAAGAAAAASAAGAAATRAYEFIVGPDEVRDIRGDILILREAIGVWSDALKVAKGSTQADKMVRENANYLLGQIVTVMDRTKLKDEDLERYIEKGLPGVTGTAVEISTATARSARAISRWLNKTYGSITDFTRSIGSYVFHGTLAEQARAVPKSPLTKAAEKVDSMIREFNSIGIAPPGTTPFSDTRPDEEVTVRRPPKRERSPTDEDPSSSTAARTPEPSAPDAEPDAEPDAKRVAGSSGRHTVRKHKKRSKSSRHRRKTVSHRRGKRTHNRRRANRRTTKRSKK